MATADNAIELTVVVAALTLTMMGWSGNSFQPTFHEEVAFRPSSVYADVQGLNSAALPRVAVYTNPTPQLTTTSSLKQGEPLVEDGRRSVTGQCLLQPEKQA